MRIDVLTLFPKMFEALNYGIPAQAQKKDHLSLHIHAMRDFSRDRHRTIDDRPFGGGPGMIMKVEPIRRGLQQIGQYNSGKVVYLSPQGRLINDNFLREIVHKNEPLIFLCGRYEGIDQRVLDHDVTEEWSIGDYILSGGEIAAMVVIDALSRLIPDTLGDQDSNKLDSFSPELNYLLDYPHYTRPKEIDGQAIPEVLLTGDHQAIKKWRKAQSLAQTYLKKPELFNKMMGFL